MSTHPRCSVPGGRLGGVANPQERLLPLHSRYGWRCCCLAAAHRLPSPQQWTRAPPCCAIVSDPHNRHTDPTDTDICIVRVVRHHSCLCISDVLSVFGHGPTPQPAMSYRSLSLVRMRWIVARPWARLTASSLPPRHCRGRDTRRGPAGDGMGASGAGPPGPSASRRGGAQRCQRRV